MKRKSAKIKIIVSVIALVVALCIGAAVVLPGFSQKEVTNLSFVAKKQKGFDFSQDNILAIKGKSANLTVDKENATVAVVSSEGNVVFNSCSVDAARYSLASILSIRTRDKDGNSYTMNSTDNSVQFGTFRTEKINETKISVSFDFYPDEKTALSQSKSGDVYVSIPVVPSTPGEIALTGLVPSSTYCGKYFIICLVTSISFITFGPNASGVTYMFPKPTINIFTFLINFTISSP